MRSFAGGSFRDRVRRGEAERARLSEQLTVAQAKDAQSHTAGFEARGGGGSHGGGSVSSWLGRRQGGQGSQSERCTRRCCPAAHLPSLRLPLPLPHCLSRRRGCARGAARACRCTPGTRPLRPLRPLHLLCHTVLRLLLHAALPCAALACSDDVIDQFGVVKGSYDAVPLPRIRAHTVRAGPAWPLRSASGAVLPGWPAAPGRCSPRAHIPPTHPLPPAAQVRCTGAGAPKEVLEVAAEPIPAALEWGEVLLSMRYAPINPADLCAWQGPLGEVASGLAEVGGRLSTQGAT